MNFTATHWLEKIEAHPKLTTREYAVALSEATGTATDLSEFEEASAYLSLIVFGFLRPVAIEGDVWEYQATTPTEAQARYAA